jgi:hypothetical protein
MNNKEIAAALRELADKIDPPNKTENVSNEAKKSGETGSKIPIIAQAGQPRQTDRSKRSIIG